MDDASSEFVTREDKAVYETDEPVLYSVADGIATVTMNRPTFNNAQNSQMTYALDAAFERAVADDSVKVIVLRGAGKHFSAGHDIGTPGRDINKPFERKHLWWDHTNKPGGEYLYAREQEVYLNMCRRWRELPKPTIAMVQGACVAGGLMLAWVCDLIVASDDAFFQDPVVRMGIPGVEYFAHPYELNPRIAKEFLMTGDRMSADRAWQVGMVNRVVPDAQLQDSTMAMAQQIAKAPPFGLRLIKRSINRSLDAQGLRTALAAHFDTHQLSHLSEGFLNARDRGLASSTVDFPESALRSTAPAAAGRWLSVGGGLVFGSAVSYALYLMGNGQAVGRLGAARVTAWASTIACVLCLAHFAATRPLALLVQPAPVMALAAAMALFSTVLPVWMVSEAIRRLGAGPVSLIGTLGPVVTLFLGWLILAEPIGVYQIVGGALVVAGVVLVGRKG